MDNSTPVRRLIAAAILERDQLLKALSRDEQDSDYRRRVSRWACGPDENAGEEPGAADSGATFPAGAAASILADIASSNAQRLFDHWLRLALAEAAGAPPGFDLVSSIRFAVKAHRDFCNFARELSQGVGLASRSPDLGGMLETHGISWSEVIEAVESLAVYQQRAEAEVAAKSSSGRDIQVERLEAAVAAMEAALTLRTAPELTTRTPRLSKKERKFREKLWDEWTAFRDGGWREKSTPAELGVDCKAGTRLHFAAWWRTTEAGKSSFLGNDEVVELLNAIKTDLNRPRGKRRKTRG